MNRFITVWRGLAERIAQRTAPTSAERSGPAVGADRRPSLLPVVRRRRRGRGWWLRHGLRNQLNPNDDDMVPFGTGPFDLRSSRSPPLQHDS